MNKCIICNKQIESIRIEILPDTEFCINCAKTVEVPRAREKRLFCIDDEPERFEDYFD
jgi:RNA polymerase-binding transcription factor DksA